MSTVLESANETASRAGQAAFHRAVWAKILQDPDLAKLPYRIETDPHGQIILSPPPAPRHGSRQSFIASLLHQWNPGGKVITECPILTSGGVKAADVAWCSKDRWATLDTEVCLSRAPEICVEILSPSNTTSEIDEKLHLYAEAGAHEIWICEIEGIMRFFGGKNLKQPMPHSRRCPEFPLAIEE